MREMKGSEKGSETRKSREKFGEKEDKRELVEINILFI